MKIHLIRHGTTAANERKLYCGHTDISLSNAGVIDLENKRRNNQYPPIDDTKLYTTGFLRTKQTLEILYGCLAYETLSAMSEYNFGIFEMKSHNELVGMPAYESWIGPDYRTFTIPCGESNAAFATRITQAVDYLVAKDQNCLVVAHGGSIASAMEYLFPQECKTFYEWIPHPGEGYSINILCDSSSYCALGSSLTVGKENKLLDEALKQKPKRELLERTEAYHTRNECKKDNTAAN